MQENFSEYNRTMQNANMTAYHLAQMREVEIRSRLQEKVESAQIEVAKKAQIEAICTFEKRKREEDRANIASLRCLQKTEIILTNDGEVEIRKELFGATKTDRSNFRIRFNFAQRKEAELRESLVVKLQGIAPITVIPESHGWYRNQEGKLSFAFPMDQTWKEVRKQI